MRFYAAEALAYLDVTEAVAPLAKAAVDEPAFRINAVAALGTMHDGAASEALEDVEGPLAPRRATGLPRCRP